MRVRITVDVGSCHAGKLPYAKELIRIASETGCDVVKFQLFRGEPYKSAGNIEFNRDWWPEVFHYGKGRGIGVTASPFDKGALELLFQYEVPYIKFSHSMQDSPMVGAALELGKEVVVSSDPMRVGSLPDHPKLSKLYVYTVNGKPEYPAQAHINFETIFSRGFHGFSDHTLGFAEALAAIDSGARQLEKHITLPYSDIHCPDHAFALKPKDLERYVREVRRLES